MNEITPLDYCQETINLKKTLESGFLVLGERLAKIKQEELWNSQWSSFSEYLGEMNINDSTASKMIAVHRMYVQKFNIDEQLLINVGWDKLYVVRELASAAKNKTEVLNLVKTVGTLNRQDTQELVREHKKPDCAHEWFEVHLRQCKICQKREQIHG